MKEHRDNLDMRTAKTESLHDGVEADYELTVCERCGEANLYVRPVGTTSVQHSMNYPKCCGAGGEVFVQSRLVAQRRMTLTFKGDPR